MIIFIDNIDGTTVLSKWADVNLSIYRFLFLEPDKDEDYVAEMIKSMTPTNVRKLGMKLGLGYTGLQAMQPDAIHDQMAHAWLQSSNNPTWQTLARALKETNCQYVINRISECELLVHMVELVFQLYAIVVRSSTAKLSAAAARWICWSHPSNRYVWP